MTSPGGILEKVHYYDKQQSSGRGQNKAVVQQIDKQRKIKDANRNQLCIMGYNQLFKNPDILFEIP